MSRLHDRLTASIASPLALLALAPALTLADPPPAEPLVAEPMLIATILEDPRPGTRVQITATLLHDLGDNEVLVEDASGRIIVEGGPTWYHRITLPADEPLLIDGEVEIEDADQPTIDIYRVVRADGSELRIRPEQGASPWSGRSATAASPIAEPPAWQ